MEIASIDIAAIVTAAAPIVVAVIDAKKQETSSADVDEPRPNYKIVHVFALYLFIYALAGLLTSALLAYSSITGIKSDWGGVNIIWTTAYLSMAAIMYTNFIRARS